MAIGVSEGGYREVLGLHLGESESEATWSAFFRSLSERGLRGVDLLASDSHSGLVGAAQRCFQGATAAGRRRRQRCQSHLMRNVLAVTPKRHRADMVEHLRRLFRSESKVEARDAFRAMADAFEGAADRALDGLEEALHDATAVLVLPEVYRRRLRTTNMSERLNQEVRRRERVIRIFPNEASALRLIGALLAEQHETWLAGGRYFDMDVYWEWRQSQEASDELAEAMRSAA